MRWTVNTTTAVLAIVIAALALGATLHEGCEMRRHNRLSVRPLIVVRRELLPGEREQGLIIGNVGTGPAVLGHLGVFFDGRRINAHQTEVWAALHDTVAKYMVWPSDERITMRYYQKGTGLPPGEYLGLFVVAPGDTTAQTTKTMNEVLSRVGVKVWYRSLYDEPFLALTGIVSLTEQEEQYLDSPEAGFRPGEE